MDAVYPKASALQGPSVRIRDDVRLHRLFERNANSYPGHVAVVHEGERVFTIIYSFADYGT